VIRSHPERPHPKDFNPVKSFVFGLDVVNEWWEMHPNFANGSVTG
jgi:hypothetical protein